MFLKIVVLKNFANFTGKHLCWSLLLLKLQTFGAASLFKRDTKTGIFLFSCDNCEIFKSTSFYRTPSGCFWSEPEHKLVLGFNFDNTLKVLWKYFTIMQFYFSSPKSTNAFTGPHNPAGTLGRHALPFRKIIKQGWIRVHILSFLII